MRKVRILMGALLISCLALAMSCSAQPTKPVKHVKPVKPVKKGKNKKTKTAQKTKKRPVVKKVKLVLHPEYSLDTKTVASNFAWPDGKLKALTFSFDDGGTQDKKLIEIFNRYGLKGTFNLNSGKLGHESGWAQLKALYQGHEIAVHTVSHPDLVKVTPRVMSNEIINDKIALEKLTGYEVRGMAYPFGTYDQKTLDFLPEAGIAYSRVVYTVSKFRLPDYFHIWKPTCHHNWAESYIKQFFDWDKDEMALFYIWGHAWELDGNKDKGWDYIERVCKTLSDQKDVWYATNIEIIDYLNAIKALKYSEDGEEISNPGKLTVWVRTANGILPLKPGKKLKLK